MELPFLPPSNEVWGKVIFPQASVCPWVWGWRTPLPQVDTHNPGQTPPGKDPPRQTHPSRQTPLTGKYTPLGRHCPWQTPPRTPTPPRDGYWSGWYASYWNAFLFWMFTICHLYNFRRVCSRDHRPLPVQDGGRGRRLRVPGWSRGTPVVRRGVRERGWEAHSDAHQGEEPALEGAGQHQWVRPIRQVRVHPPGRWNSSSFLPLSPVHK